MDLASVDKLLTTTRSVRKRLDLKRPVEPEILEECLEIALQAPIVEGVPVATFRPFQCFRFVHKLNMD